MKNTPYTVPDNYFEDVEKKILGRTSEIGRRRKTFLAICPLVVILALTFAYVSRPGRIYDNQNIAENTIDNCDIFMEIFEY